MTSRIILLLSGMSGIVLAIVLFSGSPEHVAIHFNATGQPDGWASREMNLALWVIVHLFLTGMFYTMPMALDKTPDCYISLPNRDYWLAPERRSMTITLFAHYMYVFGSAMNMFFIAIGYLVFQANMQPPYALNNAIMYGLLGVFLLFTIIWLMLFYRRFNIKE